MAQPQRGHRDELVAQLVPQLEQVEQVEQEEQVWHPPLVWPEPPQVEHDPDEHDPVEQVGRPL